MTGGLVASTNAIAWSGPAPTRPAMRADCPEPMIGGMDSVTGRCLCGAITFRIANGLRDVFNCHCARCRRFTGHHMAATAARTVDLVVADGGPNLRWYYPVPEAGYAFCATCGSSLFWRSGQTPDTTSVCAGALDPPTHLRTTRALWTSQASDYSPRPDLLEFETE